MQNLTITLNAQIVEETAKRLAITLIIIPGGLDVPYVDTIHYTRL